MNWQPMDIAPKNQQELILFDAGQEPQVFTGMNIDGEWCRSSSGSYAPLDDFYGDGKISPTAWMPLPPPPQA